MANTQAIVSSFKTELLNGIHAFGTTVVRGATTKDSFKAALYLVSATVDSTTTAYSATNEVSGTGYTAGGVAVTNANAPAATGATTYWTPSAAFAWTTVTLATAFDAVLLYNSTQSNKAIAVYTFGSQTITSGNFTLNMPVHDSSTGLLRLS